MGAPYSEDLRRRVLAAVDSGMRKWRAHQLFGVSRTTIDDWLKLRAETACSAWGTRAKKRYRYQEADPDKRRAFVQALAELSSETCVYIDEAGAENTLDYLYAYSSKGQPVYAERLGHFTERVSMLAAWCVGKVFVPMTFTGRCDSVLVETWVDKVLLPELRPGQTVILDNASFHRMTLLGALLEPLGCTLLPLPPYSPELNKIESLWHRIKSFVRHDHTPDRDFHAKVNAVFCSF